MDVLIVHSPVGGGHKAAANAVAEAARARGMQVSVLDAFADAPRWFGEAYLHAHRTGQAALPALYGPLFFASNHRGALDPVRRQIDCAALAKLAGRVISLRPRVVIATHHLPLVALGRARMQRTLDAPLVGVVTDYTSHAVWAEPGVDAFAVACPSAAAELAAHGVARGRIAITGIPVLRAFHTIPDVRQPAPTEKLRVLVTSGGFAVGPMREIVRALAKAPRVEVTIVCGAATRLVAEVTREATRLGIRANVVGFERDMASRMAEAHVIIGKAGGLTVTEALAAGRPMILVGSVPGNETLNERFVVGGGAGLAATPRALAAAIAELRARGVAHAGRQARALVVRFGAERVMACAEAWADGRAKGSNDPSIARLRRAAA